MTPVAKTPIIQQARSTLREVLSDDPISIVEQYFLYSDATEPLTLGSDGMPVDSETNRSIIESMQLALTSPDCDRAVIRLIFQHAVERGYTQKLSAIIAGLINDGKIACLDNTDLSGLDLSHMKLQGVRARNVDFSGSNLSKLILFGADLSGSYGFTEGKMRLMALNSHTVITNTVFSEGIGPDQHPRNFRSLKLSNGEINYFHR